MRLRSKYGVEPVFYRWSADHQGLHALVRQLLVALAPPPPPLPEPQPTSLREGPDPLPVTIGYDPRCYVPREAEEQVILTGLSNAGSPVVVLGPARFGKTALLSRVLDTACARDAAKGKQSRAVLIELDGFGEQERLSEQDFLAEIGLRLVQGVEGKDEWLDEAADQPGAAATRLTWLLRSRVLQTVTGRLILAIESADHLSRFGFASNVLGLLRSWAQQRQSPWDRLRITLAVSTQSFDISGSPFFNAATLVQLQDFDAAQVRALQELYRLPWTEEDRQLLTSVVGGHPFLLRLAMFECAMRGVTVREVVEASAGDGGIFRRHLVDSRDRLEPAQLEAIGRVLASPAATLDHNTVERLGGAGLIRRSGGSTTLRYPLYASYFQAACARPR